LEIVGRGEAEADRKEKCFEKQADQEIQRKNDFDEISPDKVKSENLWVESEREDLGRVLVASRDILPWEQVVKDEALVLAPTDRVVCLACLHPLPDQPYPCPACAWPLCSETCASSSSASHHGSECRVLKEAGLKPVDSPHLYFVLGVMRLLLVKKEDSVAWGKVERMMDNWEMFSRDLKLVKGMRRVTEFLRTEVKLAWVEEEEVRHCFGVLKTNAMETAGGGGQALYPVASVMSHSCLANMEMLNQAGQTITFRAKRKIKCGEELTIRYHTFLQPRNEIQGHLEKNYHFICQCQRCSSSDDLNSNFSHLQCSCGGFFREPEENLCSKCGGSSDHKLLEKVSLLGKRLEKEGWGEEVEEEVATIPGCHPSHHLRIQLYVAFLEEKKEERDTDRVVARASAVLQVLNQLDPGCTKLAGKYLGLVVTGQMAGARARGEGGMSKEMVRARMQAVKLSSDFCIVNK